MKILCSRPVVRTANSSSSVTSTFHVNLLYTRTNKHVYSWPRTSGAAMNPVDHSHAGGNHQHIGMASTIGCSAVPSQKVGLIAARRVRCVLLSLPSHVQLIRSPDRLVYFVVLSRSKRLSGRMTLYSPSTSYPCRCIAYPPRPRSTCVLYV